MLESAQPVQEERPAAPAVRRKLFRASEPVLLPKFRAFCYRLLGARFDNAGGQEALAERLRQAGLNITPGMHRAVEIVTLVIAFAVSLLVSAVLFLGLVHSPLSLDFFLLIPLVTVAAVAGSYGFMISSRISNRAQQLERELPFTLSELSVLASTGTSPIELVRRMSRRNHDPAMTMEFKKVVYKTDVQGKDLITALAETAKESASNSLREAFWDLANMIHQGGNLDEYLRNKSDDVLKLKRVAQKEFIERLQTFVDMYVSLVLVGVLMIAVAAFLLNSFGSTAEGLSAAELLDLLTYGIVPLAVVMTTVMISVAYGRAE
jgi:archaeal flagellar protein FlaJ